MHETKVKKNKISPSRANKSSFPKEKTVKNENIATGNPLKTLTSENYITILGLDEPLFPSSFFNGNSDPLPRRKQTKNTDRQGKENQKNDRPHSVNKITEYKFT